MMFYKNVNRKTAYESEFAESVRRWPAMGSDGSRVRQAAGARCCVRATKARSCVRPPSVVRGIAGIMRPALEALGQELELE